ncbi:MAG: hypothetical protein KDI55_02455 [Anaerolineae bacterium]|nr:hypothetical protein [Anaerolineae bacterium]MCP5428540.1 hypothetical protein [Chromatiaceae bacterium]
MDTAELNEMTSEALVERNLVLMRERADIRKEQLEINRILTERADAERLAKDIADLQKKHGVQVEIVKE